MTTPTSYEEYARELAPAQRAVFDRLRASIAAAAPAATETISYQMPAFRDGSRILVYYGAFRDHCSLFPASMAVIAGFGDEVAPWHNGKGTLRFPWDEPLPTDLVTRIVRARLADNATRRGRR
ncbi:MAG TPA: DUF1801 domain-containing protein [Candidatus Limnocylindrales bacterium]